MRKHFLILMLMALLPLASWGSTLDPLGIQAFALPLRKDKQLKACPRRDNICIHHGMTHPKQHSCTVHIQYTYKYTATHIHNNERIPISGHTPYYI